MENHPRDGLGHHLIAPVTIDSHGVLPQHFADPAAINVDERLDAPVVIKNPTQRSPGDGPSGLTKEFAVSMEKDGNADVDLDPLHEAVAANNPEFARQRMRIEGKMNVRLLQVGKQSRPLSIGYALVGKHNQRELRRPDHRRLRHAAATNP